MDVRTLRDEINRCHYELGSIMMGVATSDIDKEKLVRKLEGLKERIDKMLKALKAGD